MKLGSTHMGKIFYCEKSNHLILYIEPRTIETFYYEDIDGNWITQVDFLKTYKEIGELE